MRRRRLGRELHRLRQDAGLTSEQLARRIRGGSRFKISRLENAVGRPDPAEVVAILEALGMAEGKTMDTMLTMAGDAATRGWWESYDALGERQKVYADLEYGAQTVREYQPVVVPGLLQTRAYTRARSTSWRLPGEPPDASEVQDALDAKAMRQRVLARDEGPRYEVVLDEVAIRRLAAPPNVMRDQLLHLVEAGRTEKVTIRVLPLNARITDYWLPRSPFSQYVYGDGDPLVTAVDTETEDLVYDSPDDVAPYTELYSRLAVAALAPEASVRYLSRAAAELEAVE
ncbi:helix-turn-helix domain-containing protein [Catenuloplanes sp. NPDC020197]|uniref:helix-turn-helix domain-containing protein n=1 Tax=Catenuloplanes sp. NPDC020197 TaxID=3363958 RepID=UPI0037A66C7B